MKLRFTNTKSTQLQRNICLTEDVNLFDKLSDKCLIYIYRKIIDNRQNETIHILSTYFHLF